MDSKRIREIQRQSAYPDSLSVQLALLKVWNECYHEYKNDENLLDRFDSKVFIDNVCLSCRHDFGLMSEEDKEKLRFECKEWMRAIRNNWSHFKP